jgi:Ni/Co efflux regulator RcnB
VIRVLTALAAAALLALPSTASAARRDCWPKGTQTLKQSDHARVWQVDLGDERRTYGCLYRTGRRVALDQFSSGGQAYKDSEPPYRLAGRYVAQKAAYVPGEAYQGWEYGMDVIDLRTGRLVRAAGYAWNDGEEYDPETPPRPGFRSMVLTTSGLLGWISTYSGEDQAWRLDSRGAKRLDRAPSRSLRSLHAADGRLEWTNAGVRKRASFR